MNFMKRNTHTDIMIYDQITAVVYLRREQSCFILETMNFNTVSDFRKSISFQKRKWSMQRGLFQTDSIIILFGSLADHPHLFQNNYFIQPFIRSIASVQKYFLHSFICSKIFVSSSSIWLHPCKNFLHLCIHLAIPFQTAWLSVSHPCACRAFIPEEHLRMRGHIH